MGWCLRPMQAVDLQLHTTYSDGTWAPAQLIDYLLNEQFALAAITDHDRPDSVSSVLKLGAEKGLPLLAAVEMSTSWRGEATDVLCYGFTPEKPGWNDLLSLVQGVVRRQNEITQEVYKKLLRGGYEFPHEQEVLKEKVGEPLGSNDLGLLLLHHGYSTGPGSIGKIMTTQASTSRRMKLPWWSTLPIVAGPFAWSRTRAGVASSPALMPNFLTSFGVKCPLTA